MGGNDGVIFPTEYLSREHFEKKRGLKAWCFWLVGNSGSGKSTIARATEKKLTEYNYWVKALDGDNMRDTLNSDLDFSVESRNENVRRSAEIAKMFLDHGTSTVCCFISPSAESRKIAREIIGDRFRLVYIKASHEEVIKRDVKGLYKDNSDNMKESLKLFEEPSGPDLIIDTTNKKVEYSVNILFNFVINQPM
jgi:adenylyl-sulfate kinase